MKGNLIIHSRLAIIQIKEISPADIQALEDFLLDNPKLDRLESSLEKFNVFETLKITETEVHHSYVLARLPLSYG